MITSRKRPLSGSRSSRPIRPVLSSSARANMISHSFIAICRSNPLATSGVVTGELPHHSFPDILGTVFPTKGSSTTGNIWLKSVWAKVNFWRYLLTGIPGSYDRPDTSRVPILKASSTDESPSSKICALGYKKSQILDEFIIKASPFQNLHGIIAFAKGLELKSEFLSLL